MQETSQSFKDEEIAMTVRFKKTPAALTDVCLFSSFSFTGFVEEYVYFYLNELKRTGFSIMFISTSELSAGCVERLSAYCFTIIERENKCPDFGSWKTGLSLLDWGNGLDNVLLVNDSVFGPFHDLAPVIASMKDRYDVWGMTDNMENERHIQSYFIFFNAKAVASPAFSTFWKNVKMDANKKEVILAYEVGLSRLFRKNHFRLGAYADIDTLNQQPGMFNNTNPLLVYWKKLIAKHSFPFLKRELLIRPQISKTYSVYNVLVHVGGWKKLIEQHSHYPTSNILLFLSNYCTYLQQSTAGISLQKRTIVFIAPVDRASVRLLVQFLKWLKTATDLNAEIILTSKEPDYARHMFRGLAKLTVFYELLPPEKRNLKERLSDETAIVFWGSLDCLGISNFLSFLDVPQLVLVSEPVQIVQNFFTAYTLKWIDQNIVHFITTSHGVEQLLIKECNKSPGDITLIRPFTSATPDRVTESNTRLARKFTGLPAGVFVAGIYASGEDPKTIGLLPIIIAQLCTRENDIHVLLLNSEVPEAVNNELAEAGLRNRVHVVTQSTAINTCYSLLSVMVSTSFDGNVQLMVLDAAQAGLPVICFDEPGITDEYHNAGIVSTVQYQDITALTGKIFEFYTAPEQLASVKNRAPAIVAANFTVDSEAPLILEAITKYYDNDELMLAESRLLTFFTHIYYENSWEEIKYKLKDFDNGKNHFLFSISEACLVKDKIIADIKDSFTDAYYLVTSNVGKDIGGKMALIDLYLFLGLHSDYIVFLHDKQSPHSVIGESWKKGLFKIIDINNERTILSAFRDPAVGIVGDREYIINEYEKATDTFVNNNRMSKKLLMEYDINIDNYDFLGGSIYWIRSTVIEHFFSRHHPISTRENLEAGNVLDLHGERLAHTWERMFSWIAAGEGYTIKGI